MCVNVNSATQGRRPYRDVPSFLPWLPRLCVCECVREREREREGERERARERERERICDPMIDDYLSITLERLSNNSPTLCLLKAVALPREVASGVRHDKWWRALKAVNQSGPRKG